MIARTWSGTSRPDSGDAYLAHLESVVLPEIRHIDGHRGAYVLRDGDEFQVVTLWDSMEAIRRFAGDEPEAAVVPKEARALLARFDERVRHFEIVHASADSGA